MLVYVLPTNKGNERLKFFTLVTTLVGAYYGVLYYPAMSGGKGIVDDKFLIKELYQTVVTLPPQILQILPLPDPNMNVVVNPLLLIHLAYFLVTSTLLWSYRKSFMSSEDWENPRVVGKRRMKMRTDSLRWFSDPEKARAYAASVKMTTKDTGNVLNIDGEWDFQFHTDASEARTIVAAGEGERASEATS